MIVVVVGSRGWSCGGGAFKFLSFVVVDVVKRYMVVVVVVGSGRSRVVVAVKVLQ